MFQHAVQLAFSYSHVSCQLSIHCSWQPTHTAALAHYAAPGSWYTPPAGRILQNTFLTPQCCQSFKPPSAVPICCVPAWHQLVCLLCHVLQHLELFLVNVACDDPGAAIGSQLVLPLLQERLDAAALEYKAERAKMAEEEIIAMEVGDIFSHSVVCNSEPCLPELSALVLEGKA